MVQEIMDSKAHTGEDTTDDRHAEIEQSVLRAPDDYTAMIRLLEGLLNLP